MKNLLLLSLAMFTFCQLSTAQSNWSIGKVGFYLSPTSEAYKASSFEEILNMAKNKEEVVRDLSNFEGELLATVDGSYVGFQFILSPPKSNRALLITPSLSIGREMLVSQVNYDNGLEIVDQGNNFPSPDFTNDPYMEYEEATYCIVENELKVDIAWLHYKKLGARFTLYGGFGGSFAGTFNNDFIVMGREAVNSVDGELIELRTLSETYESKNTVTGKAFVYGGIGYQFFRHFELAIDTQYGLGMQKAIGGGPASFIHRSNSLGFSLRYVL